MLEASIVVAKIQGSALGAHRPAGWVDASPVVVHGSELTDVI
jgi:hypothetical protein